MERDFIRWLRERLPPHECLRLGPGDDAAVVRLAAPEAVVTVDLLTEGVDFFLGSDDPRRIGRKALAVNLSDLAAMAARPVAAVVALAIPRTAGWQVVREMYEGMIPLAEEFGLAIAGGDTNTWDGPLAISVTAIGCPTERGPLTRRSARPSDAIVVTGRFGGSILGHSFDFTPRVREAMLLHQRYALHAGIDASDGLAMDLARLAEESGCGAELDLARVPISDDAERLADRERSEVTALDHALGDGEDFELILAVPPDEAERMLAEQPLDVPLAQVGRFIEPLGLWQRDADGSRRELKVVGYEHRMEE